MKYYKWKWSKRTALPVLMGALLGLTSLPALAQKEPSLFTSNSTAYDFDVQLSGCDAHSQTRTEQNCKGMGTIALYHKRDKTVFQTIKLSNILGDGKHLFYNFTNPYQKKDRSEPYTAMLGDFNNDEIEDIAIWSGNQAGYGGASYHVYLYDKPAGRMIFSKALSKLTVDSSGMFEIEDGRIVVSSKSGCCEHSTKKYAFANNRLDLVESITETPIPDSDNMLKVVTKQKSDGKWRTFVSRRPVQ